MLIDLFKTCGLNETETKVLMCLVSRGETIVSLISKSTKLKRPTVYAALDNLVRIGLVFKKDKSGVLYFSCASADSIPVILKNRAEIGFNEVADATQSLSLQLNEFVRKAPEIPNFKVEAIESVASVYAELENVLNREFCAFFNPQIVTGMLDKLVLKFLDVTAVTQPRIREIVVAGPRCDWYISHIKNPNHKVKIVPASVDILSDVILSNRDILINNYAANNESAIKIRCDSLYKTLRAIFEMAWG